MQRNFIGLILLMAGAFLPLVEAQERFAGSGRLDEIVDAAVKEGEIPGAVLLVGNGGGIVHRKAYGNRSLTPKPERMTLDTIFDAASLTKVVATAPSIMKLFEEGKIRLNDRVTDYLPEFQGGESRITVRHLLTHYSGLRADVDLEPKWSGYETGVSMAMADEPVAEPGERFLYSDINYILLGEIVRRVSGEPLSEYARKCFFAPLGMRDTTFLPDRSLLPRIAPTERSPETGLPFRGVVHDPTARNMGGVAGHAGVFTTASDLAAFAEMMIGLGSLNGTRVLAPAAVRKMTTPQSPADRAVLRGIGWDIDSPYSTNRGELLPLGSYGHTGFTGVSLWIDPATKTYIILMTNRVHPDGGGSIVSLRCRVATAVAAALGVDVPGVSLTGYNETLAGVRRRTERNGQVKTGLDVLAESGFDRLRGKRVALITNHTGQSREGERDVDLMIANGVRVAALLSPEHGWLGQQDSTEIGHSVDAATGIRVWSLYSGENRRPTSEMLADVEMIVFDIQDAGARFYTYMCTMLYALEEAAKRGLPFLVLDRPNPITGVHVEGPLLDESLESFVGCYPLPLRHGMTLGEIATMANQERKLGASLEVVRMRGWERGDWFDATGLTWSDPSPNMRSLNAALLYPGLAMLEGGRNYSVGRGTDSPFEQIGADWINGRELASYLNALHIPGIRAYATRFQPSTSPFKGKLIEGVRFVITDRDILDSTRLGLELAAALEQLYPGRIEWGQNERLIGDRAVIRALQAGVDPSAIRESWSEALGRFVKRRSAYLLYH